MVLHLNRLVYSTDSNNKVWSKQYENHFLHPDWYMKTYYPRMIYNHQYCLFVKVNSNPETILQNQIESIFYSRSDFMSINKNMCIWDSNFVLAFKQI